MGRKPIKIQEQAIPVGDEFDFLFTANGRATPIEPGDLGQNQLLGMPAMDQGDDTYDVGVVENFVNRVSAGMDQTQKSAYEKLKLDQESGNTTLGVNMGNILEGLFGSDFLEGRIEANEQDIAEAMSRVREKQDTTNMKWYEAASEYMQTDFADVLGSSMSMVGLSLGSAAIGMVGGPGTALAAGAVGLSLGRYQESLAESMESYNSTAAELKKSNPQLTEKEIHEKALMASDEVFNNNMALLALDIPQYLLMFGPMAKLATSVTGGLVGKTVKYAGNNLFRQAAEKAAYYSAKYPKMKYLASAAKLAGNTMLEGAEEGLQYSFQDKATAKQVGRESLTMGQLFENEEFQHSVKSGMVLGGVMGAGGAAIQKVGEWWKGQDPNKLTPDEIMSQKAELRQNQLWKAVKGGKLSEMFGTVDQMADAGVYDDMSIADPAQRRAQAKENVANWRARSIETVNQFGNLLDQFPDLQQDAKAAEAEKIFRLTDKLVSIDQDLAEKKKSPINNQNYVNFYTDLKKDILSYIELITKTGGNEETEKEFANYEESFINSGYAKNPYDRKPEEEEKTKKPEAEAEPAKVKLPEIKATENKVKVKEPTVTAIDGTPLPNGNQPAPTSQEEVDARNGKKEGLKVKAVAAEEPVKETAKESKGMKVTAVAPEESKPEAEPKKESKGITVKAVAPEIEVTETPAEKKKTSKSDKERLDYVKTVASMVSQEDEEVEKSGIPVDEEWDNPIKKVGDAPATTTVTGSFRTGKNNAGKPLMAEIKDGKIYQPEALMTTAVAKGERKEVVEEDIRERKSKSIDAYDYEDADGNKYVVGFQKPRRGQYTTGSGYLIPINQDGSIDHRGVVMFYAKTENKGSKSFLRYDAFEKVKKELGLKPVKADSTAKPEAKKEEPKTETKDEKVRNEKGQQEVAPENKKSTSSKEKQKKELEDYFKEKTSANKDTKYNPDLSGEGELALREQEKQLLQLGADKIQAHGLTKGSIGQQFKDLLNILTNGLDSRGKGQLYTAPLVMSNEMIAGVGSALGTGGGTAYIDGGFIILARAGTNNIKGIEDIGGILINQAIADSLPELVNKLQKLFPDLSIDSYSNAPNVISEINAKKDTTDTKSKLPQPSKKYSVTKDVGADGKTVYNVQDKETGETVKSYDKKSSADQAASRWNKNGRKEDTAAQTEMKFEEEEKQKPEVTVEDKKWAESNPAQKASILYDELHAGNEVVGEARKSDKGYTDFWFDGKKAIATSAIPGVKFGLSSEAIGKKLKLEAVIAKMGMPNVEIVNGIPMFVYRDEEGVRMYEQELHVKDEEGNHYGNIYQGKENIKAPKTREEDKNEMNKLEALKKKMGDKAAQTLRDMRSKPNDITIFIADSIKYTYYKAMEGALEVIISGKAAYNRLFDIMKQKLKTESEFGYDPDTDPAYPMMMKQVYEELRSNFPEVEIPKPEVVQFYEQNSASKEEYAKAWEQRYRNERKLVKKVNADGTVTFYENNTSEEDKNIAWMKPNKKDKAIQLKNLSPEKAMEIEAIYNAKTDSSVKYFNTQILKEEMPISNAFSQALAELKNIMEEDETASEFGELMGMAKWALNNNLKTLNAPIASFFKVPGYPESYVKKAIKNRANQITPANMKSPEAIMDFFTKNSSIDPEIIAHWMKNTGSPKAYVSLLSFIQSWDVDQHFFIDFSNEGKKKPGTILPSNQTTTRSGFAKMFLAHVNQYRKENKSKLPEIAKERIAAWKQLGLDIRKAFMENRTLFENKTSLSDERFADIVKKAESAEEKALLNRLLEGRTIGMFLKEYYQEINKNRVVATDTHEQALLKGKKNILLDDAYQVLSAELDKARNVVEQINNLEIAYFHKYTGIPEESLKHVAVNYPDYEKANPGKTVSLDNMNRLHEFSVMSMTANNPSTRFLNNVIQNTEFQNDYLPSNLITNILPGDDTSTFQPNAKTPRINMYTKFAMSYSANNENIVSDRYRGVDGKWKDAGRLSSVLRRVAVQVPGLAKMAEYARNSFVQKHKDQAPKIHYIEGFKVDNLGTDVEKATREDVALMLIALWNQEKPMHMIEIMGQSAKMAAVEVKSHTLEEAKEIVNADLSSDVEYFESLINYYSDRVNTNGKTAKELAELFVYNYAANKLEVDDIFQGDDALYGNYDKKTKRADQLRSTGILPVLGLEGGLPEQFKAAIFEDGPVSFTTIDHATGKEITISDPEAANGTTFISEKLNDQIATSTGSLYQFKDTVKALYKETNPADKSHTMIKSNWIVLTEDFAKRNGGTSGILYQMWKRMQKGEIELATFTSNAKVHSHKVNKPVYEAGSSQGKIHGNIETFNMKSREIIFQQDLRYAKKAKDMRFEPGEFPKQVFRYYMRFPEFQQIEKLFLDQQKGRFKVTMTEIMNMVNNPLRFKEWISDQFKDNEDDAALKNLMDEVVGLGGINTVSKHPTLIMRLIPMIGQYMNKKAVMRIANRFVFQEVGSFGMHDLKKSGTRIIADNILKGERIIKGKVVPAQCKIGKSLANQTFEKNGKKYIFIIRVPTTEMHSVSLMEVVGDYLPDEMNNVIITDPLTQKKAGSDNDGDQRFAITKFRTDKEGKISKDKDLANQVVDQMFALHTNPEYFGLFNTFIDTNYFDDYLDVGKKDKKSRISPVSLLDMWDNNSDSARAIGVAARTIGVFQYLNKAKARIAGAPTYNGKQLNSFELATWEDHRKMGEELANLTNIIVDNAKEGKMYDLGISDSTTNMYFVLRRMGIPAKEIIHLFTKTNPGKKLIAELQKSRSDLYGQKSSKAWNKINKEYKFKSPKNVLEYNSMKVPVAEKMTDRDVVMLLNWAKGVASETFSFSNGMSINESGILNWNDYLRARKFRAFLSNKGTLKNEKKDYSTRFIQFRDADALHNSESWLPYRMALSATEEAMRQSIFDTKVGAEIFDTLENVANATTNVGRILNAVSSMALAQEYQVSESDVTKENISRFYDKYIKDGPLGNYLSYDSTAGAITINNLYRNEMDADIRSVVKLHIEQLKNIETTQGTVLDRLVKIQIGSIGWDTSVSRGSLASLFPSSVQADIADKMAIAQAKWKNISDQSAQHIVAEIASAFQNDFVRDVSTSDDSFLSATENSPYIVDHYHNGEYVGRFKKRFTYNAAKKLVASYERIQPYSFTRFTEIEIESASNRPVFDSLPMYDPAKKNMVFAGIGSRETPEGLIPAIKKAMDMIAQAGYKNMRSGDAKGADRMMKAAFSGKTKDYFGKDITEKTHPRELAIAKEIHPKPDKLSDTALALQARNTNQIFGDNLDTPVDFVLCYTLDGMDTAEDRTVSSGGTAQSIQMAAEKGIPIINLADPKWEILLSSVLSGEHRSQDIVKLETSREKLENSVSGVVPLDEAQVDKVISKKGRPVGIAMSDVRWAVTNQKAVYATTDNQLVLAYKHPFSPKEGVQMKAPQLKRIADLLGYKSTEAMLKNEPELALAIENNKAYNVFVFSHLGESSKKIETADPEIDATLVPREKLRMGSSLINNIASQVNRISNKLFAAKGNQFIEIGTNDDIVKTYAIGNGLNMAAVSMPDGTMTVIEPYSGYVLLENVTGDVADLDKDVNFLVESIELIRDRISQSLDRAETGLALSPRYELKPSADPGKLKYMDEQSTEESFQADLDLQDFIRKKLQARFPKVKHFTNAEAFQQYLDKNHPGQTFSLSKLGAAIGTAVMINEKAAVQSSQVHEYGHIYYDMLPEDHPIKVKLRELYSAKMKGKTSEQVEEAIITDLGKEGTAHLKEQFKGDIYAQVLRALKNLWAAVKLMFGKANEKELISLLSRDMLRPEPITSMSIPANKKLKYQSAGMTEKAQETFDKVMDLLNNLRQGPSPIFTKQFASTEELKLFRKLHEDKKNLKEISEKKKSIEKDGKPVVVIELMYSLQNTIVVSSLKNEANPLMGVTTVRKIGDSANYSGKYSNSGDKWIMDAVGTPVHRIVEAAINGEDFGSALSSIKGMAQVDLDMLRKKVYEPLKKEADDIRAAGGEVFSELLVGHNGLGVGGKIDVLFIYPDGKVKIRDIKTSQDRVWSSPDQLSSSYTKRTGTSGVAKEEDHRSQMALYAYAMGVVDKWNSVMREPINVEEIEVQPIYFEGDKASNSIDYIELEPPVTHKLSVEDVENAIRITDEYNAYLKRMGTPNTDGITVLSLENFATQINKPLEKYLSAIQAAKTRQAELRKKYGQINTPKEVKEELNALNQIIIENKEKEEGVKGLYNDYKKHIAKLSSILQNYGKIETLKQEELVELYNRLTGIHFLVRNDTLSTVLKHLKMKIVSDQLNAADVVEKDMSKLDVWATAPSHVPTTQPFLRELIKMQLIQAQKAEDSVRAKMKELDKLDKAVRDEYYKDKSWVKRHLKLVRSAGANYYENLWDYKMVNGKKKYTGSFKKPTDASLNPAEKAYIEHIEAYKKQDYVKDRLRGGTGKASEELGGLLMPVNSFEEYSRNGFYKGLARFWGRNNRLEDVKIYAEHPNHPGFKDLYTLNQLLSGVENSNMNPVMKTFWISRYTNKANRLFNKKQHDAVPGNVPEAINAASYRQGYFIRDGKAVLEDITDPYARVADENLQLRGNWYFARSRKEAFSLDVHSAMQRFVMDMEFEAAMHERAYMNDTMSVIDMANIAQIYYQTNTALPNVTKWVNKWAEGRLMGKGAEEVLSDWDRMISKTLVSWTYFMVMTFNWKLGVLNLAAGVLNNMTFGDAREYAKNQSRWAKDWKKCRAIVKTHKLVEYRAEAEDNSIFGTFGKVATGAISIGEEIIASTGFISRIPDEIFDNITVDKDGGIEYIDPNGPKLTYEVIARLKAQSSSIQGKYGTQDRRNYHNVAFLQMAMQFKTWVPDMLRQWFGGPSEDVFGNKHVGIAHAAKVWLGWAFMAPTKGMAEANAYYQKYNSLEEFKRAQHNAMKGILMIMGMYLLYASSHDDDEKDTEFDKLLLTTLQQFMGMLDPKSLTGLLSVPAKGTIDKIADLLRGIITNQTYNRDSKWGEKGETVVFDKMVQITPYRNLWANAFGSYNEEYGK